MTSACCRPLSGERLAFFLRDPHHQQALLLCAGCAVLCASPFAMHLSPAACATTAASAAALLCCSLSYDVFMVWNVGAQSAEAAKLISPSAPALVRSQPRGRRPLLLTPHPFRPRHYAAK